MKYIVENWFVIVGLIAVLTAGGYAVYVFVKMPSDKQLNKVREWLLYAVTKAEKELGGGTGQIKLRYVYDMFVARFTWLARVISFEACHIDFPFLIMSVYNLHPRFIRKHEFNQRYGLGKTKSETSLPRSYCL